MRAGDRTVSVQSRDTRHVLHLVLRGAGGAFDSCRACCTAGDAVVFLDDGVRQILLGDPGRLLPPGVAIHYSQPDLRARGLAGAAEKMRARTLGDEELCALLQRYDLCLSWK